MHAPPIVPPDLYKASKIQDLARGIKDSRMAMTLTGLSVALVGVMLMKEFRDLFRDKPHYHRDFHDEHHR